MTSVAATAGKAQGSQKWGVVGDIDTRSSDTTFTYGLAFNPTNGTLTVTDSGKVLWVSGGIQLGTPSVHNYALASGNPAAAGTDDRSSTTYAGAGTYSTGTAATNSVGVNLGIGARYASVSARTNVTLPATITNGPRGVTYTSDGTAWVVNSEAVAPVGGAPGAILRYTSGLSPLTGAGWTGTWAQKDLPGVHFYRVGAATTPKNTVLVNSEVSDRLQEYAADGTWIRSIMLDVAAGSAYPTDTGARNPYGVAVDPVDGSLYIPLINFSTDTTATPFLEKRDSDGNVIARFASPGLLAGQVVMGAAVEPKTQHVFAWSQGGSVVEWDKNGVEVGRLVPGTGAGQFPGLTDVRGIAFDANGRMYLTVAQGTNTTRVMILGKTPDKVSGLCATMSADRTTATLAIDCGSTATAKAPYQQTQVLDYVVEARPVGSPSSAWAVKTKDLGVSYAATQTVSGLDPATNYEFRVSAWNEAGNGDWTSATPVAYVGVDNAFSTTAGTAVTIHPLANDSGTDTPTAVALVGPTGASVSSLTTAQGTWTVAGTALTFAPAAGVVGNVSPVTLRTSFGSCQLTQSVSGVVTEVGAVVVETPDVLPDTGGPAPWPLWVGIAGITGGVAALRVARRRVR